jgi:hypothetical protein
VPILLCVSRFFRTEIATQGGSEQQMPAQETVIRFGWPCASKLPITQTGEGSDSVAAPRDRFIVLPSLHSYREYHHAVISGPDVRDALPAAAATQHVVNGRL